MPNTIKIRNGTTAPSAGSFQTGEPAFDRAAGKLYIKNAAGVMVEIGAQAVTSVNGQTGAVTLTLGKPLGLILALQ